MEAATFNGTNANNWNNIAAKGGYIYRSAPPVRLYKSAPEVKLWPAVQNTVKSLSIRMLRLFKMEYTTIKAKRAIHNNKYFQSDKRSASIKKYLFMVPFHILQKYVKQLIRKILW